MNPKKPQFPLFNAANIKFGFLFIISITILGCGKGSFENPFENVKTLDCRNLIVNHITLADSKVELEIENTCNTCEEINEVYLYISILDLSAGGVDTIGFSCQCYGLPENNSKGTYSIATDYTELPNKEDIQITFDKHCTDLYILDK